MKPDASTRGHEQWFGSAATLFGDPLHWEPDVMVQWRNQHTKHLQAKLCIKDMYQRYVSWMLSDSPFVENSQLPTQLLSLLNCVAVLLSIPHEKTYCINYFTVTGPCGLRSAIEAKLLGARTVVVEKRDRFSRNNVLHLWPFVIHDLKSLGAKIFYPKFCAGKNVLLRLSI